MDDVFPPSTALAFVTRRGEKCKSSSLSAIIVKNWQKTVSTENKSDVLIELEKGEQIVDICHNVQLTCISTHRVHDDADRNCSVRN